MFPESIFVKLCQRYHLNHHRLHSVLEYIFVGRSFFNECHRCIQSSRPTFGYCNPLFTYLSSFIVLYFLYNVFIKASYSTNCFEMDNIYWYAWEVPSSRKRFLNIKNAEQYKQDMLIYSVLPTQATVSEQNLR